MVQTGYWAAIRKDAGDEFIMPDEVNACVESVNRMIAEHAAKIPQWHEANPVVRIVRIEISEV